jgi:hypothetical protein
MRKKTIQQSALKVMRTKIKQVWDNLLNQELNDAKEKENKHS